MPVVGGLHLYRKFPREGFLIEKENHANNMVVEILELFLLQQPMGLLERLNGIGQGVQIAEAVGGDHVVSINVSLVFDGPPLCVIFKTIWPGRPSWNGVVIHVGAPPLCVMPPSCP